jgi:17 kDa outer membrane surface antigen
MRENNSFFSDGAVLAAGIFLVASIFIAPGFARATEAANPSLAATSEPVGEPLSGQPGGGEQSAAPSCSCPQDPARSGKPKFANLNGEPLDESDEVAALASVHMALNSTGDGQAYVWQRSNGRLSGLVRPVSSFRNDEGQVCRHVIVMLTTGKRTQKMESTACRLAGGRWQLGG